METWVKKILIVEDNLMLAEALCEILRSKSYLVTHRSSVTEGLEQFEKTAFDLLIMDLHLKPKISGESSSGIDLIYNIRHRKKSNIPIIVTTGLELVTPEEILSYGVDLFFYKNDLSEQKIIDAVTTLTTGKKIL